MKAKSARRNAALAEALKANLKRRKAGAAKAPLYKEKEGDAAAPPQPGPKEAAKQG
jgi:hypothetical protein